ncbi:MAG: PIG-L deacetylase family protein [Candidatus Sigynarchaeota archaeon]
MTVIAIGPHPDDPEEGAGGTLARLALASEKLVIVYIPSGGRGIPGIEAKEAVKIREREARAACKILGAEPKFIGLSDGACFPDATAVKQLQDLLEAEEPKAILTCWPLDTHGDHRATGYMAIEAYCRAFGGNFNMSMRDPLDLADHGNRGGLKFPGLFFWATEQWHQSVQFKPDILVNIDATIDTKMALIEAHASQNRGDSLVKWVEKIALQLGEQSGGSIRHAEGFMSARPGYV